MKIALTAALVAAGLVVPTLTAHAGANEDSFVVESDDRGAKRCFTSTYYPAKYRVDPRGKRVSGAKHSYTTQGDKVVLTRSAPVYIETRTRIKSDYTSLRPTPC